MGITSENIKNIIILLVIFVIIWHIYYFTYQDKYGDLFGQLQLMEVPDSVKCFFGEAGCEEGDIDGWTICHGLMYFIIGLVVPGQYLFIILISILFEMVQPLMGNNARYIVNPLVNLTGYAIGSLLSPVNDGFREKYSILVE